MENIIQESSLRIIWELAIKFSNLSYFEIECIKAERLEVAKKITYLLQEMVNTPFRTIEYFTVETVVSRQKSLPELVESCANIINPYSIALHKVSIGSDQSLQDTIYLVRFNDIVSTNQAIEIMAKRGSPPADAIDIISMLQKSAKLKSYKLEYPTTIVIPGSNWFEKDDSQLVLLCSERDGKIELSKIEMDQRIDPTNFVFAFRRRDHAGYFSMP